MEAHLDALVPAGEGLVDGVVDDLVDEVMEAARARRADVHARPQPDGLEALENGDVFGGVTGLGHKKIPANAGFLSELQSIRTAGRPGALGAGETRRGGRATASRSSGSSMLGGDLLGRRQRAAARASATTRSAVSSESFPGSGRRPGAKRSRGGAQLAERCSQALPDRASSWVSSNAQALELVDDVQRPVPGDARRPRVGGDRGADRVRPDRHDVRDRAGGPEARQARAADRRRSARARHAASATLASSSRRTATTSAGSDCLGRQRGRGGRADHRLAVRRERGEERRAPDGVELREDVVEQEERRRPAALGQQRRLGEEEREHGVPLLPCEPKPRRSRSPARIWTSSRCGPTPSSRARGRGRAALLEVGDRESLRAS